MARAAPRTAVLAFSGGLDEPARAAELRRAGWSVAALPEGAAAVAAVAAARGRPLRVRGRRRQRRGRRLARRAQDPGSGMRLGLACEDGRPQRDVVELLCAAGLCGRLDEVRPPALVDESRRPAATCGCWPRPPTSCAPASAGRSMPAWPARTRCSRRSPRCTSCSTCAWPATRSCTPRANGRPPAGGACGRAWPRATCASPGTSSAAAGEQAEVLQFQAPVLAVRLGLADGVVELRGRLDDAGGDGLAEQRRGGGLQRAAGVREGRAHARRRGPGRPRRAAPRTSGGSVNELVWSGDARAVVAAFARSRRRPPQVSAAVTAILADVRERGDDAVREHTLRLDGVRAGGAATRSRRSGCARRSPGSRRPCARGSRSPPPTSAPTTSAKRRTPGARRCRRGRSSGRRSCPSASPASTCPAASPTTRRRCS